MVIVTDVREQAPYNFDSSAVNEVLATGDYSVKGGEHLIAIERKTLSDLVSSLSNGRQCFEQELARSLALEHFRLVFEGSLQDIIQHRYRSRMLPQSVIQTLIAWSIHYRLPIWFAGNRAGGRLITDSLLSK